MASLYDKKNDLHLEPRAQVSSVGLKSIKVDFRCFDCSYVRPYGHYENRYVSHGDSGSNHYCCYVGVCPKYP